MSISLDSVTIKEDFYARIREKYGDGADITDLLDHLWESRVIDGVSARKYCIRQAFAARFAETPETAKVVQGDVAEEYGVSTWYVWSLTTS